MKKSDDRIEKLKKYFTKRDDTVMAFVFGSQAKGRAYSGSDTVPSTYKEIVRMVGGIPPFSSETAERLSRWTELRNILAHEYLDIRWHRIEDFIKNSESYLKSFIKATRKILEKEEQRLDFRQDIQDKTG